MCSSFCELAAVYVDVLSWQHGAPGPEIRETCPVRDLIPDADFTFNVKLQALQGPWEYIENRLQQPTSGYIAATCSNCDHPKAWAFYVPGQGSKEEESFLKVDPWPMVEFGYQWHKPRVRECAPIPSGSGTPLSVCLSLLSLLQHSRPHLQLQAGASLLNLLAHFLGLLQHQLVWFAAPPLVTAVEVKSQDVAVHPHGGHHAEVVNARA